MRKYLASGIFVLLLASASVWAQSSITAGEPATREDVTRLFGVMKSHDQVRAMMDSVLKQQRIMMRDVIKKQYPDTSEDELRVASRDAGDRG